MKVTNLQKSQCRIGDDIKAEALRLGFDAVGFAHAAPVSHEAAKAFTQWIAEGKHDCMQWATNYTDCLLYTSPSPRDRQKSRMPSSA